MQLRQQFLWSAQQTVEKYLKAILLFNGRSARFRNGGKHEFGHDIAALLAEVRAIPTFTIGLDLEHENFLTYLAEQGPNRYLTITAHNTGKELHTFDASIWRVRRYCQHFADHGIGCIEPNPRLLELHVRSAQNPAYDRNPQRFRLAGGELEKVLDRPSSNVARRALVWANQFYGAKRRTKVLFREFSSSDVPPKERGWLNVDWAKVAEYVKP